MAAWNPVANEIFLKAVEIQIQDDRRKFLDEACHGDDRLRAEVEALIAAGEQAGSFLESPPPGVTAAARKMAGKFVAHREHWPKNPLTEGSYTCYTVNQFLKYEGPMYPKLIGGNLVFAGEHTNSFHIWQGFMEGACLSGIDAANEILGA